MSGNLASGSIVIDSSALFELIIPGAHYAELAVVVADSRMNAPDVLGLEILSALRREVRLGRVEDDQASTAVVNLRSAPIRYWRSLPLASRIWELRHNISSYDAAYVALAELLSCPLVTLDERLHRAPGLTVEVLP